VVETVLVGNDADVCEAIEEHERSKLVLLFRCGRRETGKQRAGTAALEVDSGCVEDTPHESRTIETVWTFSTHRDPE